MQKLEAGQLEKETDDYGCNGTYITGKGEVTTMQQSAELSNNMTLGESKWCGASKKQPYQRGRGTKRSSLHAVGIKAAELQQKRRPLKKGSAMIDKRTKDGKAKVAALRNLTPRELAARAALERLQCKSIPSASGNSNDNFNDGLPGDDGSEEEIEVIEDHPTACGCRCCEWDKLLCQRAK